MKKAIIIGYSGQDGTYLWQLLEKKKYRLVGISSSATITSEPKKKLKTVSVSSYKEISQLIKNFQPDEIYYLAAVHHSSSDKKIENEELFRQSMDVNVLGLVNCLEAIKTFSSSTKLFYAASSHIFGNPSSAMQNELTPFDPECVYGITKTAGIHSCRFYRNDFNIFASVGIFYNHESPLRASKYVSKKIIETAIAIKLKKQQRLEIGNLNAAIDWGYSPDYVEAAYRILQLKKPEEFIISSGKKHLVKDFVEEAFSCLNLDWKKYVIENPSLITKKPKQNLLGDNRKLRKQTGWEPSISFKKMVELMVNAEMKKHVK